MSDLYYTQEEIGQLQKDIIEKYFKDDKETIENIKKYEIIGYESGTLNNFIYNNNYNSHNMPRELCKYESFINIYGNVFTGILDSIMYRDSNQLQDPQVRNLSLKAFSKSIQTSSNQSTIEIKEGILLPKIILEHIIKNNLIYKAYINTHCSEKYKDFIDIIKKERDQQKEIEELKSKLAEQTKLNEDICHRMFELKEQMLKN
jgi:hypothetical protein